ncbi:MAG: hypothetical protein GXY44_13080 [Phycisphaerales bacterium]|nr:hypothetical protein [Phycisphaerales bacterium]
MSVTPVHPGPGTYYAPRPAYGSGHEHLGSGTSLLSPLGAYQPTYGYGAQPRGFSSIESYNAPARDRIVDTTRRFGDEPEDVYMPTRSRFSALPYGLSDYYQFQNLVRETSPTALRRQLETHYGSDLARSASNNLDNPFLNRGYAPKSWSNPEQLRSFFVQRIAERPVTPPPGMQWVRPDTGAAVSGPVDGRLMQSSLFGMASLAPRPEPAGTRSTGGQSLLRSRDRAELDDRQLLRYQGSPAQQAPEAPSWASPTIPPGLLDDSSGDLFSSMQMQIEQQLAGADTGSEPGQERLYYRPPSATQPGQAVATLKTFVGDGPAPVNTFLAQAEQALQGGHYYRAAGTYDLARAADPGNPLPLLGRAMALLAAGEYMTSATNLFLAISHYELLAYYRVDLRAFVPDLHILDRRRAEIEQRLAQGDEYRLRFLLGYAEYCSGFEELGLTNMSKAAQAAPEQMHEIRRFVRILAQLNPPAPQPTP